MPAGFQVSASLDEVDPFRSFQMGQFGFGVSSSSQVSPDLPGAGVDLDFQNGAYFQAGVGNSSALVSCSRASTGYTDDTVGNWTSFLSNVARITNKGLLVEESRTNGIRNNSMQGGSAPSTAPTNWTVGALGGISPTLAFGTSQNVDFIDITYSGTTSSAALGVIELESATQIAALNGQKWSYSFFLALPSGSLSNVTLVQSYLTARTAAGAGLSNYVGTFTPNNLVPLGQQRRSYTPTLTDATTAFVQPRFVITPAGSGLPINITLRIGWPQLELGDFATSPIRTTTVAVTRAADVVTLTTSPVFGTAYSIFAKGTPFGTTAAEQVLFRVDDNSNLNSIRLRRTPAFVASLQTVSAAASTVLTGVAAWTAGTSSKLAGAVANLDQAASVNGATVLTGAGALPVSIGARVSIGNGAGIVPFNGYVERCALWPTARLSNADLVRITS